jgi:hypothetical protein
LWWPELFEGLDGRQRWAIVQAFAGNWHEGWAPNREDVASLTGLLRGDITDDEYARRSLEKARRRPGRV